MFNKLLVLFLYAVAVVTVALLAWDYVTLGAGLNPAVAVGFAAVMGFSCRVVMTEVAE